MQLQKFTKNQKQKRIVIGSIVGIILLIGGIVLYRAFAFYKEEQSFDILQGNIPDFVYGDVKLAINVNGTKQASIPSPKENYVVQTECDKKAEIDWDYDNWGPIIKNVSEETRCSLNFVSNNKLETLGSILGISNLSMDSLLTEDNINKLVASKNGMTYLAKSPDLVKQMQDANGKYTEDIKKKILNSTVISEDMKYEAGLPCYIYNKNQDKNIVGYLRQLCFLDATESGSPDSLCTSVLNRNNEFVYGTNHKNVSLIVDNCFKIDLKKYTKLEVDSSYDTNDTTSKVSGSFQFGLSPQVVEKNADARFDVSSNEFTFHGTARQNHVESIDISSSQNQSMYFRFKLTHGSEQTYYSVHAILNSVALY